MKEQFTTDEQIESSIQYLQQIKKAMQEGKIARTESDMRKNLPKLMFSERTADELLQAVTMIKRYKVALEQIAEYSNPTGEDGREMTVIARQALERSCIQ